MTTPQDSPYIKVHHDGSLEIHGLELIPWVNVDGPVRIYTPDASNVRMTWNHLPAGARVLPTPPERPAT
ncbi:hypothetical protein H9W91_17395 [Streptomyces alfalfae]|uniref:hypothetical protein n=1 Tax=Streptomyces alfalfae TaxID=1642299 RepID=UPI001BAC4656|nr:hypothetical protein [Streptomyces alfalfae]QUI32438.1 hypothetical protein H9W91_17395 [Streptomyces alfalfae]